MEVSFFLQGSDSAGIGYVYADIRYGKDSYAPAGIEARLRIGAGVKVKPEAFNAGVIDKKLDKEAGKKTLQLKKVETGALAIGQLYEQREEVLTLEHFRAILLEKIGKKKRAVAAEVKKDWAYWFGKAVADNQWSEDYARVKANWLRKLQKYDPTGTPEKITPDYLQDFNKWLHLQSKDKSNKRARPLKDSYTQTSLPFFKALLSAAGFPSAFIKVKSTANEDPIEPHTWEEVAAIWKTDLSGITMKRQGEGKARGNKLELVRDRYIFVCLQGPRFSDTMLLESVNILKQEIEGRVVDVLRYRQKKTKGWATVAIHPIATEIISKYQKDLELLFPEVALGTANSYLKQIGKAAGLTRKVQKVFYSDKKRMVKTYELWEIMTTHMARATWATNLLEAGLDITQVMKAGGWSTLDTVMKYARVRQKSLHEATVAAWDKFKI